MSEFIHHVRYNRWATARTLESVRPLTAEQLSRDGGSSHGGVYGTLAHIYQADQIWFARLMGRSTGPLSEFQPPTDMGNFEKDWMGLHDRYLAWAEGLSDADWRRAIAYRDSKGNPYENLIWQILLHLANHDSYHRGQVAALLRQLGHKPLGTDLITYYREMR